MLIQCLTTDTTMTLWWEKPETAPENYAVYIDGAHVGNADKTHYTVDNLSPDTDYTVEVAGIGSIAAHTRKPLHRIDVTREPYNAVGDGVTLNTSALQRAIDDCGADDCVYLPKGIYMSGALYLHSHMTLYVDECAVLQGTQNIADYEPRILSRFEGTECMCYASLINMGKLDHTSAPNCEDVLICGGGTIAGGGYTLARNMIEHERKLLEKQIAALGDKINEYECMDTIPGRVRGRLINMSNCRNVRITNLLLADGASWNVHMIYSDNITTDHCTIRSRGIWNGDGWDPDSSENCTIFACRFETGDDSISIKSGKNPEGNIINRPTKHIRIFDCKCVCGNGITMGSEMSGGVDDVRVWDCDMGSAYYGIEIKGTKKRGGYVRNVHMRDCTVARVLLHAVGYNDDGIGAPVPPKFSDCTFDHVRMLGKSIDHKGEMQTVPIIEAVGFDVPGYEVENVKFIDCTNESGADIVLKKCKHISINID